MLAPTLTAIHDITVDIGEMPILVRTDSLEFAHMLEHRYGHFVTAGAPHAVMELEVRLVNEQGLGNYEGPGPGIRNPGLGKNIEPGVVKDGEDGENEQEASVRLEGGRWVIERGSYRAELDPERRCGWVRQTANPYSIDGVLRILHSLILAREGGFLVHAASAVRNGRAFLFAGVSGAGKTTLARLAPPDVVLLTDEISYVREGRVQDSGFRSQKAEGRSQKAEGRRQKAEGRRQAEKQPADVLNPKSKIQNPKSYEAFGTPFAGELARVGENLRAPLAALYLLAQGPENRIEPVGDAEAARALLRHILFFAQDKELVGMVFQSVLEFVSRVPVRRLVFAPDLRVWELII